MHSTTIAITNTTPKTIEAIFNVFPADGIILPITSAISSVNTDIKSANGSMKAHHPISLRYLNEKPI